MLLSIPCKHDFHALVTLSISFPTDMWTAQATTGERPPLLVGHTLTKCDHNRAILFGARAEGNYRNDTYALDMDTWVRYIYKCIDMLKDPLQQ